MRLIVPSSASVFRVEPQPPRSDADREVVLDDEQPIIAQQTRDDTDRGWGERPDANSNDERLLADRPPHW